MGVASRIRSSLDGANVSLQKVVNFAKGIPARARRAFGKGTDPNTKLGRFDSDTAAAADVNESEFPDGWSTDARTTDSASKITEQNEAFEAGAKGPETPGAPVGKIGGTRTDVQKMEEKMRQLQSRIDALDPSAPGSKTWYSRIWDKVTGNKYKVIAGLGISGMAIHASILHEGTDGETAQITRVSINDDATKATVSFDAPSLIFRPTEGDTITFNNIPILSSGNDYTIIEVVNDTQIIVSLSTLTNNSCLTPFRGNIMCEGSATTACSPGPGAPNTCAGSTSRPSFTCHSDFGNQMLSNWRDLITSVGRGIGEALGVVIDEFGNVVTQLISPVVTAITQVGGAVAGAGGKAFCAMLPIFCDSTIWLLVLVGIIGLIIFVAIK